MHFTFSRTQLSGECSPLLHQKQLHRSKLLLSKLRPTRILLFLRRRWLCLNGLFFSMLPKRVMLYVFFFDTAKLRAAASNSNAVSWASVYVRSFSARKQLNMYPTYQPKFTIGRYVRKIVLWTTCFALYFNTRFRAVYCYTTLLLPTPTNKLADNWENYNNNLKSITVNWTTHYKTELRNPLCDLVTSSELTEPDTAILPSQALTA